MEERDRTPQAATVDVPQAPDSNSGQPVTVPTQVESGRLTRKSRRGIGRTLVFGGTLVLATFGSDAKNVVTDNQKDQARGNIAKVEEEGQPISLQSAQQKAAYKLFGAKGDKNAVETAQKIVRTPGSSDILQVGDYLPEQVEVSEDGKTFAIEGQDYGINRMVSDNGSVYVIASRSVIEERLFDKDKIHAASPMLVGGAHNDVSSDRNNDGVVTEDEVRETADESARENIRKSIITKKTVIGKDNQVTEVPLS